MDFQKVADAIEKSGPEIKDLLFSEKTGQFLNDLVQQNNLDEEKTLKMIDEVGYIILGLKERSSFENSLSMKAYSSTRSSLNTVIICAILNLLALLAGSSKRLLAFTIAFSFSAK